MGISYFLTQTDLTPCHAWLSMLTELERKWRELQ
ncbi:hypothetical protein Kp109_64 [Klebsiella phage Kp109]|uniref:Uncharacterized protein n=1 Tax=Klebsiella phage Kp109 TaxID=3075866 RepID=A0AAX4G8M5_9CAUD|nr:hypothetical protein Kp109_64 [Klebsiella phage Kp109]